MMIKSPIINMKTILIILKIKKTLKNLINLPTRSPSVVPSSDNLAGSGWCYGNYSIEQEHSSYVV